MADKKTELSIKITTVDAATAKIKAINDQLDRATKPIRDFKSALSDLKSKSGLDDVIGGFKGVGNAIGDLLGKVAMIGGIVGVAVAGLIHIADEYEDLGKKAERLGVGVDFLAEMRDAATRTGVPIEALDASLEAFNQNLGQARAGTGRMAKFLNLVSPALERQLVAAKNNAAAFDILAGAMAKLTDPAKRAALAQKTLGDSALAPLFAKGPKAIAGLREHYLKLAGPQKDAAAAGVEVGESLKDLKATTDGLKAALLVGLAPALTEIVKQLSEWFEGHREDVKEWAKQIGEKLPGAVNAVVDAIKSAVGYVRDFIDKIGGWKVAAIGVAAIMAGPLIGAVVALGSALATMGVAISGLFSLKRIGAFIDMIKLATVKMLGLGEASAAAGAAGGRGGGAGGTGGSKGGNVLGILPPIAVAMAINEMTGGSIQEQAEAKGFKGPSWDWQAALKFLEDEKRSRQMTPSEVVAQSVAAVNGPAQSAKVTVDFANAPPGTRVKTDPQSTADVDLSVGYQMAGAQ